MKKEIIKTTDAVGKILAHDVTRIVKGEFKGSLFKKGHFIEEADIDKLLDIGKTNIYILALEDGDVHEDEAGVRLGKAITGDGIEWKDPKESRVNLFALHDGLLKVNAPVVDDINDLPNVICATLPNNTVVKKGEMLAGTKVIPLVVKEADILAAEKVCADEKWVLKVQPFLKKKVGVVITGSEVYYNRIPDGFAPVITKKVENYGSEILAIDFAPDDVDLIAQKILEMKEKGADLIFTTGGMSVDPDDMTPTAIAKSGAEVIKYGAAALPGAMFMLAYLGDIPVFGVPACGMFFRITIVDLLLPRVLAGEKITKRDIVLLGHGGLCRQCETCEWPKCTFGKSAHI